MYVGIIIVVAILIIAGVFIYDTIISERIMKESQNKIVTMLSKVYDAAEIVIIGVFSSIFSWGNDDDDLDDK